MTLLETVAILVFTGLPWFMFPSDATPDGYHLDDPTHPPHFPEVDRLDSALPLPPRQFSLSLPNFLTRPTMGDVDQGDKETIVEPGTARGAPPLPWETHDSAAD